MEPERPFWSRPVEALIEALGSSAGGLSCAEGARRAGAGEILGERPAAPFRERPLGFVPLPPIYYAALIGLVALYAAGTEAAKRWFYQRLLEGAERPRGGFARRAQGPGGGGGGADASSRSGFSR
jgi:hypothetical protein